MQIKGGKLFLVICLIFFLITFISAINNEVKVKTMPEYEVELAIGEESGEGNFWKFFSKIADEYGDAVFAFPTNELEFDLIVTIKKDNIKLSHPSLENPYKLENNPSGEPIYLELVPSWFTLIKTPTNETEISEETITEINETEVLTNDAEKTAENLTDENTEQSVTGLFTSEEKKGSSNKTFYYGIGVAGFLMMGAIAFITAKRVKLSRRRRGLDHLDKILEDMNPKKDVRNKKDLIEDVKKKMQEIEEDITKMKE
ncbi:hypothetical protein J4474_01225 [Candidatus Pacearchaeota archaeon]|nr:hypothetical protein [Candidatus Pacearchaeota archaeon]